MKSKLLLILVFFFFSVVTAGAVPHTWTDIIDRTPDQDVFAAITYTYTDDISDSGFKSPSIGGDDSTFDFFQSISLYDNNHQWHKIGRIGETQSHSQNAAPVPEPATLTILGIGLVGLARASRKNKNQPKN